MNVQTNEKVIEENILGTVVWFSVHKGYGFIRRQDQGQDVFVHFKEIRTNDYCRLLQPGEVVKFGVAECNNRLNAVDVVPQGKIVHVFVESETGGINGTTKKI